MFIRAFNNYDADAVSASVSLVCEDVSLAQEHFKEECDINEIVRRFGVTGQLPQGVRMPTYGDFSGVFDFQSAANAIALAHESFDQMPAEVRLRFNNDPGQFVEFCSDVNNKDEAKRLGLIVDAPSDSAVDSVVPLSPEKMVSA